MRTHTLRAAGRAIVRTALGAALASSMTMVAGAQTNIFQYRYGGENTTDAARGGVLSIQNAHTLVVGETDSITGTKDVYLIETDGCNSVREVIYDIGGDDVGHKIRGTADGGFIIVGETENENNCCTRNDIFLIKLDASYRVDWIHTYGGNDDERGSDVQVVSDGYIVTGRTRSFGQGDYDAYLMKTDLNGNLVWAKVYGGPNVDYFMSCAVLSGGDIVASGSSKSFTAAGDADLIVVRVNPANGIPTAGPYYYGGGGDEIGWSIVACANGDVAVAGNTTSVGGNSEGYLLRMTAGLVRICDRTYGGTILSNWDELLEMKETSSGTLIATGNFYNPFPGFGNYDMFFGEFGPCFTNVSTVVHGGASNDQGWSIAEVTGVTPTQYVLAGLTESFSRSTDVYLVRQLANGFAGCYSNPIETRQTEPQFDGRPVFIPNSGVNAHCTATGGFSEFTSQKDICTDCFRGRTTQGGNNGEAASVRTPEEGMILSSYPNPVHSGEKINLDYAPADASVSIAVSDVAGKEIYTTTASGATGHAVLATEGWATGTYLIQVKVGDRVSTQRVVVQ